MKYQIHFKFYLILKQIIISFVLIALVHYIYDFLKNNLTNPKIKDLVNKPNEQYKEIYKSMSNQIKESKKEINTENKNQMKDELKKYLTSLNSSKNNKIESVGSSFSSNFENQYETLNL